MIDQKLSKEAARYFPGATKSALEVDIADGISSHGKAIQTDNVYDAVAEWKWKSANDVSDTSDAG